MHGYPQFSCWISVTLVKVYLSCIIISRGKHTFELVGTVLKLIISDSEKIPSNINLVMAGYIKKKNSSLPVAVHGSKTSRV